MNKQKSLFLNLKVIFQSFWYMLQYRGVEMSYEIQQTTLTLGTQTYTV